MIFKTPKEFIADVFQILIRYLSTIVFRAWSYVGHISRKLLRFERCNMFNVYESFSEADSTIHIYTNGNWNLMPYFVLHALTIPKVNQGEPLVKDKIRPGSCWTKLGNYKCENKSMKKLRKSRDGIRS